MVDSPANGFGCFGDDSPDSDIVESRAGKSIANFLFRYIQVDAGYDARSFVVCDIYLQLFSKFFGGILKVHNGRFKLFRAVEVNFTF